MTEQQLANYDSPWKESIERFFQAFMAFFFPRIHDDINWVKGYEFLDKELQQVARDASFGQRRADKLVKVWRRNGKQSLILIHIEVQSQYESNFAQRMYVYNYRIFDKFRLPVVSLAVLGDDRPSWRPDRYKHKLWGSKTLLRFPIVKLLDGARSMGNPRK